MKNTKLYLPIILLLSGASMYAGEVAKQQVISKLNIEAKQVLSEQLTKKFKQDKLEAKTTRLNTEGPLKDVKIGAKLQEEIKIDPKDVEIVALTTEKQIVPLTMKAEVENTTPQVAPVQFLLNSVAIKDGMTLEDIELKRIQAEKEALLQKEAERKKALEEKKLHFTKHINALETAMTGKGLEIINIDKKTEELNNRKQELQVTLESDNTKLAEHKSFLKSLQAGQIQQAAAVPAEALVVAAIVEAKPIEVKQEVVAPEVKKGSSWNPLNWGSKTIKETLKVETPKTPAVKQADSKTK